MTKKLRIIAQHVADHREAIAELVAGQQNLTDIMQWLVAQGRKDTLSDVVTQDEYTYDVIVEFRDGIYLVYDVSWLGGISAVSVWDHKPTPTGLLQDRLMRGWKPKPSLLNDGEVVLGYAACVQDRNNMQNKENTC